MAKHMREAALHRARRPRVTYHDRCKIAADRAATGRPVPEKAFIKEELIEQESPRKHSAKRQRIDQQDVTSNEPHANTAVDNGARLSDSFQLSVRTHGLANESIAEQANRVSQDVNRLFGRTSDLLQTAQGRVAALEQALTDKVQEADGLRAQVVKLTADLEIEKMSAKRTEQSVKDHDKIIGAAKALVESDFKDLGARMQQLAQAVSGSG